jgi:hypothetical protein
MDEIRHRIQQEDKESEGDFAGVETKTGVVDNVTKNKTQNTPMDDAHKISGQSQTKNVTINIDSFIKGFNPTNQIINSMNPAELERWMIEMFTRIIRSTEIST